LGNGSKVVSAIEKILSYADDLTTLRRDFHQHPELGFEESRTSARIAELLEQWGISVTRNVGKTGVVGVLQGTRGTGRAIGLRADMDALPMDEQTNLPYASRRPGFFHGCGDGHTARVYTLAVSARRLSPPDQNGRCRLLPPVSPR
jgi:hippurate hydrolase